MLEIILQLGGCVLGLIVMTITIIKLDSLGDTSFFK